MSAITITQAQGKALRHHFDGLREFAAGLYAAHGGWFKPGATAVRTMTARRQSRSQRELLALAQHVEAYSPNLSVELRYLASRG